MAHVPFILMSMFSWRGTDAGERAEIKKAS